MNPSNSTAALTQLENTQKGAQNPNAILQQQQKQLGVNDAQQTVTGLRGAINNTTKLLQQVAPSVMGRTGNSLVTNAQATKQISNEQAPLSQNLTQEGTDYNNANQDLDQLQQEAQTAASGIYQGQQDKLSYAQNLYNTLFGKEQAAQATKQAAADRAEQIREFNAQLASTNANAARAASSGSFNLNNGSTTPGAQAQQRKGGGFNFQDSNGGAINAVQYAQAKKIPIRTQLQAMAKEGDTGAKTALNYVGNDFGVNVPKLRNLIAAPAQYNSTVSLLRSLGFKI